MRRQKAHRSHSSTGTKGPFLLLLLLLLFCFQLNACEIWSLERGLKQLRHGIQEAEGLGMEEAALYHLHVAQSLLEAAEKQYEEADFPAAERFLEQSENQLQRARRLHAMSTSASTGNRRPPRAGDAP